MRSHISDNNVDCFFYRKTDECKRVHPADVGEFPLCGDLVFFVECDKLSSMSDRLDAIFSSFSFV